MRVIVSAFACCPDWGSEPSVGWNTVKEISQHHEVWVMVEPAWKERIRKAINPEDYPDIHFVYVKIPVLSELADGALNCGASWLLYYYLWQFKALQVARKLHQTFHFDLAHHVTFVKITVPSQLFRLGIPFIFGPVGGGEKAPSASFYAEFGRKTQFIEALRLAHLKLARFDPWLRRCLQNATLTLGVTDESSEKLASLKAKNIATFPAISLEDHEAQRLAGTLRKADSTGLTLIFVGRLLAWKGIHLAIRALSFCKNKSLTLRVIGDGPAKTSLSNLAKNLGVASRVEFTGNLPRPDVLEAMSRADGLLFPSLHDSGGFVVIEAMAVGLPVICLDLGGPNIFVDTDSGWKIQAQTPDQTIQDLAHAIDAFAASPEERRKRGENAKRRCLQHFTSTAHGQKLEAFYKQVIGK